jgi:hypothetical protein
MYGMYDAGATRKECPPDLRSQENEELGMRQNDNDKNESFICIK